MSYQLRAIGFSRLVCQITERELDYIRTLILITDVSQVVELRAETFISDHGISSYLDLGGGQYLEGNCDPDNHEVLALHVHQIIPVIWKFNLTTKIPF